MGPADAYLSSVVTDDAAAAAVAALGVDTGIYNVADDEPLTRRRHFDALGQAVGRDRLSYPPAILGRLAGSKFEMLLRSQRVSNQRIKDATDWAPRYFNAEAGWSAVVAGSELARNRITTA